MPFYGMFRTMKEMPDKSLLAISLLQEIAQTISNSGPDAALAFLLDSALNIAEAAGGFLMIPHGKLKEMIPLVEKHGPTATKDVFDDQFRAVCFQQFVDEQQQFISGAEFSRKWPSCPDRLGGLLFAPVILAGQPIGLLVVYRARPEPLSAEEAGYLEILIPFMGTLIDNSRLHSEMLHKDSRLSALYDISQRAESLIDLRDVYDSLEDVVQSFIDFDRFMIYFLSPDGQFLEARNEEAGQPYPAKIQVGTGPVGSAALAGKPVLTYTTTYNSLLILPVIVSQKLIGVVVVASKKSYAYKDEDIIGLRIITTQIASIDEMFKDLVRLRGFTQHILQSMNSGVLIFDNNGKTTFSNAIIVRMIGQPVPDGWTPGSSAGPLPEKLDELVREVLATRAAVENRTVLLDQFSPPKTLEVNAFPFRDESGNMLGTAFFLRDITQSIQLEERLKRADRLSALGTLAAGMAHEIRNPLTGMKMIVQLLMSEFPGDDPRREPLQIVQNEIDRLERIIGTLLDFARPSKPQVSRISVVETLQACILLIQNQLNKAGIKLTRRIAEENTEILADPGQMKQVFLNILTNAIQATPHGGELEVSVTAENSFICTAFRDTGVGIPAHLQKVIFDPFVTTKDDGTGLGLSVVLRIVEEHSGKIEMVSREGQGTTFSVFLPRFRDEKSKDSNGKGG